MLNNYKSEMTLFLEELKQKRPTLEAEQRQGRDRLWDKTLDPELLDEYREGRVKQRPYVYQPEA